MCIRDRIRTLKQDFYEELGEISWEAFRTKEKLSPKAVSYTHLDVYKRQLSGKRPQR